MAVFNFIIFEYDQEYREGGRVSYYTIVPLYGCRDLYNDIHNCELSRTVGLHMCNTTVQHLQQQYASIVM
jgi:pyrrolidone-carboxylate peptidase